MGKTNTASINGRSARVPSVPKPDPSIKLQLLRSATRKPTTRADPATRSKAPGKRDQILNLLRRNKGASLQELQTATGWQAHSVRGFLSGTVKKRLGLTLTSKTTDKSGRRYRIIGA